MKISVIIPVYNEEKVIINCLKSLFLQTRPQEIVVVDDGSTDKSLKVLSEFLSSNRRIKLQIINQKHLGPGAARNLGSKIASGEILVFVDSDMTFAPDFIAKLIQPIEKGLSKGTFTKEEFVSNWGNVWARCWNYNLNIADNRRIPKNYPDTAPVFRSILKIEFDRVGGFTEGRGWTDDWTLSQKLGYQSTKTNAVCYHANPEALTEVYKQARWIGKNEFFTNRRIRIIGNIFRFSAPMSLFWGIGKTIWYHEPVFIIFKFIYDLGVSMGLATSLFTGERNK